MHGYFPFFTFLLLTSFWCPAMDFPLLSPAHVSGMFYAYVSFRWSLQLLHNISIMRPDPKVHLILPCSLSHPNMHTSGQDPFSFLRAIAFALAFLKSGWDPFPLIPQKNKMVWGSLAKFNRDLIFYCFGGNALAKAKEGDKERN